MPSVRPLHQVVKQISGTLAQTQPALSDDGRQLSHSVRAIVQQLLALYPPQPSAVGVAMNVSGDAAKFRHNAKGTQQTSICMIPKDKSSHDLSRGLPSAAILAHFEGGDKYEAMTTPTCTRYAMSSTAMVAVILCPV